MAASADLTQIRDSGIVKQVETFIKNAQQVYLNQYGAIDKGSGGVIPWADAAASILVGPIQAGENYGTGLGNTAPANPNGSVAQASLQAEDHMRFDVSVAGTSAATDAGSLVYLSDDNTFTLTRGTLGLPAGFVWKWKTGTTCDVVMFGLTTLCAIYLGGCGAQLVPLGHFDAPNLTTAVNPIQATIPGRYRVRSIYATVAKPLAGGTSIVFTFKKNAAAFTTGGVLTLNTSGGTGGTGGDQVSATAITQDATTIFSESDVLTGSVVVTGTFTADTGGNFNVFALIDRQLGV